MLVLTTPPFLFKILNKYQMPKRQFTEVGFTLEIPSHPHLIKDRNALKTSSRQCLIKDSNDDVDNVEVDGSLYDSDNLENDNDSDDDYEERREWRVGEAGG